MMITRSWFIHPFQYLSDDNYHARQARQMQTLEETLALQEAHIKKKVEDKQKIVC